MQYVAIGIRCLIWSVFVASSISKVMNRNAFDAFVTSVRDMRLLPADLARRGALLVVATEAAVCVLLALPVRFAVVAGFSLAMGLLAAFACGIVLAVRRGVRASCRCFGVSTAPLGFRHVARNLTLTATAAVGVLVAPEAVQAGGVVVAVVCGLTLGALVAVLDDLLDLFQPVVKEKRNVIPDRGPGFRDDAVHAEPGTGRRLDQAATRAHRTAVHHG